MRKYMSQGGVAALFLGVLLLTGCGHSSPAQNAEAAPATPAAAPAQRQALNPPGTEASPNFSNGILAGNTLYISGMQGTDKNGKLLNGIAAQTRGALEQIKAVCEAAGMSLNDVVSINVYLKNVSDWPAMNKEYVQIMPSPRPSRTSIQAGKLVNDALIEISAIAVKH